jgi:predicted N-acyltransferase
VGNLELSFSTSMVAIDRTEWDALAARYDSPFLAWGFLALLEESGSIVPEKGWNPLHLLARRDGRLVAAAPLYAKTGSWGEFVFDFEFARVAEANGITWYPKLVGMVPATPAPVWRVLVAEGEDDEALTGLVIDAAIDAARGGDFGGFHVLWPDKDMQTLLRAHGTATGPQGRGKRGGGDRLIPWEHQSFLWTDEGYGDFAGYLGAFSKNMRRNVLRERSGLDKAGVTRRMIEAGEAAATPGLLSRMADFYESTNDKFGPWGAKWLERDFFLRLPEFMPEGWVLGAAFDGGPGADGAGADGAGADGAGVDGAGTDDGGTSGAVVAGGLDPVEFNRPIGLSFMMKGRKGLWGRYWGAARFEAGLHFELCYYLPIEWALERGLAFFDPGMGSEHKARRGFRSVLVPSFHAVFDERMAGAMARSLAAANRAEAAGISSLNEELPFKKTAPLIMDTMSGAVPDPDSPVPGTPVPGTPVPGTPGTGEGVP